MRFIFYFPGRPVQSDTISTSLGSIQPYAAINARRLLVETYTYPPVDEYVYNKQDVEVYWRYKRV